MFKTERHKQDFLHDLQAYLAARALVPDLPYEELPYEEPVLELTPQLHALIIRLACVLDFYEALPINADLTHALDRWLLWLLEDELGKYETSAPVATLYRRRLASDEPTTNEWRSATAYAATAASAARAAADDAANAYYTRMRTTLIKIVKETP